MNNINPTEPELHQPILCEMKGCKSYRAQGSRRCHTHMTSEERFRLIHGAQHSQPLPKEPTEPKNTDRNGDPLVGKILDIIDEERSRYKVAVALAQYVRETQQATAPDHINGGVKKGAPVETKELDDLAKQLHLIVYLAVGFMDGKYTDVDQDKIVRETLLLIQQRECQQAIKELQSLNMNIIGFKTKEQVQEILTDRLAALHKEDVK